MSRDSSAHYLHLHHSHHADLLESFTHPASSTLAPEDIYVPPHLQPVNPEDEDDVVPDQHAAFGIQRATQNKKEVSWRDLGLEELVRRGPGGANEGIGATGIGWSVVGPRGTGSTRRDEPVRLALRRRPGAASVGVGMQTAQQESSAGGGAGNGNGNGNGMPR